MSRFPNLWLTRCIGTWCALLAPCVWAAADYGLGRPATATEIAGWDIDVRPDGEGLPPGHGSVAEGEKIYAQKCASCHGDFGDNPQYAQLAGGVGSLTSSAPVWTVGSALNYATTLFDYINRAMPFPNPKSLTPDEVYALCAYILNLSNIVPSDAVLDQKTLPQVKMPNRDGFTTKHGLGSVKARSDIRVAACMRDCAKQVKIVSELPAGFTEKFFGDISQEFRGLNTMNQTGEPQWVRVALNESANAPPSAYALAQKNGCTACHALDHKIVGPAFRDVAAKYKGDVRALQKLEAKVRNGGAGVWGVVPMPPQTQVSQGDLQAILKWVLDGTAAP
jgi:cytochrome c551/c552